MTQRECHNVTQRDAGAECQCAVSCEVRHATSSHFSFRYVTLPLTTSCDVTLAVLAGFPAMHV